MVDLRLGDNKEILKTIPDNFIDLTVTSPPYDNLRTYEGTLQWGWNDFTTVAQELYRVTKEGGVVVWVVGDATINGSETLTSFRQAMYFVYCGFNLHDTMIYKKQSPMPQVQLRYEQEFEYMFCFSKGRPKTFNPIMLPSKYAGQSSWGNPTYYDKDGNLNDTGKHTINDFKLHGNIFEYLNRCKETKGHPAPFPQELAKDMIASWSNEGDVVLDPFMGSGTTGKMANQLNRDFIGIEIVPKYFEMCKDRIGNTNNLW